MIEIIESGFYTTIQDLGRWGWQRFGVPVSGAMDSFAMRAANQLVGNPWQSAVLEVSAGSLSLRCWSERLVALTGCGAELWVDGHQVPAWMAARAVRGALIEVRPLSGGGWNYLSFSGGIDTPLVLGSRSSYPRAGLGTPPVKNGDTFRLGYCQSELLPGRSLPPTCRPSYSNTPEIMVILGPQQGYFTPDAIHTFLTCTYEIRRDSDRMGYRLEGPTLTHVGKAEILSDGMSAGSIQVPANGQPLVMMSDCPTTGGYPKLAAVASASLPVLAQCVPGSSQLRFKSVGVDAAQQAWRDLLACLEGGIEEPEETWLG